MQREIIQEKDLPTISILIIAWNVERTLKKVLDSINIQTYPQKKIEILLIDGNSTDRTHEIAKQSKIPVRIIQSKFPKDPEACRGYGIPFAKNEILAFLDADNFMPHKNWLRRMMVPLIKHKELYGVQSLRYAYRKKDALLNKYFALLGSADPVGFYLKKDDRLSYLYDFNEWNLYGKIYKRFKEYFLIEFDTKHFPTLGCNGFFFRKRIVKKLKFTPQNFFHIDSPLDLARMGYNKYAIVNEEIIHDTAGSFLGFLRKRARYMRLHYVIRSNKRRYKVFDPSRGEDVYNLGKFIFFSITFVEPLIFSIRGYLKKRDSAWFIHPIFCFSIFITYSIMVMMGLVQAQMHKKK